MNKIQTPVKLFLVLLRSRRWKVLIDSLNIFLLKLSHSDCYCFRIETPLPVRPILPRQLSSPNQYGTVHHNLWELCSISHLYAELKRQRAIADIESESFSQKQFVTRYLTIYFLHILSVTGGACHKRGCSVDVSK